MKRYVLMLPLLVATASLAQQPNGGFSRKMKTSLPTPGLAERLKADVKESPGTPGARQAQTDNLGLTLEPLRLRVVHDETTKLPIFIERKVDPSAKKKEAKNGGARLSAATAASTTFQFMNQVRGLLKLENPEVKFKVASTDYDEIGQTHVRLTHMHRGVKVYGSELVAHLTDGDVTLINGRYKPVPDELSTTPKLTLSQASALALTDVQKASDVRSFGDNLLRKKQPAGELVIVQPKKGGARLAYQLTVRPNLIERWEYTVDAQTGEVINKYNHTCTFTGPAKGSAKDLNGQTRTVNTYQVGNNYYLIDASRPMFNAAASSMPEAPVGAIVTVDAKNGKENDRPIKKYLISSTTNKDWNATAVSAHYNASLAYEYYKNTFKREGLDGAGTTMVSVINITDTKGKPMDNAFWNGDIMGYGNGNRLKPLAGGLDVAGHEMTHGVIEKTADLEYMGQSGAMNESFADIFGAMIDRTNWTLGESVVTPTTYPSGAMRNLSNPNQGGKAKDPNGYQPATMDQFENLEPDDDNGGVHSNSGIANFAYYKFATAIGKDKAEQVYYRALTRYLVRTSQFLDLRLAVIKAAGDLYGPSGAEVTAAQKAFDAVGIVEGTGTDPGPGKNPDLPVASGEDLMLLTEIESGQLYSTNMGVTPANFEQKTSTALTHRPSVTDDGKLAYYVSSDKRIRVVNLTGTPSEFVVSSDTIWDNVAISKDGSKLAALTADRDGSIYVYSFEQEKWAQFKLHNPTYSEGVQTGDVQFADSFEWDFSGENLIYDAYNGSGDTGGYWDVSFINVWSKKAGDFAEGRISRLFSRLDKGVSIGNPSFSKNSPHIIAFDYMNENDDTYAIVVADQNVGKAVIVYENNTLGLPNYSRLDDQLVFSHIIDDKETIVSIALGADKLSATGKAVELYSGAKWPVWYTQATRTIPAKAAQTITFNTIADRYTNQGDLTLKATASSKLKVSFQVKSGPAKLNGTTLKFTGTGTVTIRAIQEGNDQFSAAAPVERTFKVKAVTALEPTWADVLSVYPNPVSSTLTIELPAYETVENISLKTVSGATVAVPTVKENRKTATLDVASLPKGMYILQVQTLSGSTSKKIVKE
ncbi:M4 family metallopeptidase [Spirosoma oryzicola]|uniref:M4 family metallopeptidase n=1 Tax=Spirosoma oryzicola TaxID=2898794 RepID=UPI001E5615B5|nr:M4 family metallopeptidase [Spirosoma oryzicola]UHG91858.1 M4 family metallopeptidase [Spirosoma oryzicola]